MKIFSVYVFSFPTDYTIEDKSYVIFIISLVSIQKNMDLYILHIASITQACNEDIGTYVHICVYMYIYIRYVYTYFNIYM